MSEIERSFTEHEFWEGGVIELYAEEHLQDAIDILGRVGKAQQAIGFALTRAANTGKTVAKRLVTKEYTISGSEFLAQTKNINHFTRLSSGEIRATLGFRGHVIPLTRFRTSIDSNGRVVTQVKRSGTAETLNHAFAAHMKKHYGIYERVGKDRFPVRQLYGPSTPQMIGANEEISDVMSEKMQETAVNRIDHEMQRIMNGGGK